MALSQSISGAATGAGAGAQLGGGWGALLGGGLGAIGGLFQDDGTAAIKRAQNAYNQSMADASRNYQQSQGDILGQYSGLYTPQEVAASKSAYTSAASGANPSQYAIAQDVGAQTYQSPLDSWQRYLDPSIALQQEAARRNIEESAAGQGGLYSGAAAREIAQDTANLASQGFQQAMQNASADQAARNQANTQNLQNLMSAGNYNVGLGQTNLANLGTAYDVNRNLMDTVSSGWSDLNKTLYSGNQAAAGTNLNTSLGLASAPTSWDALMSGVQGLTNSGALGNIKSLWG